MLTVYLYPNEGYVSAAHEDIEFPAIAATDSGSALMTFTLSGNGGPSGADNGGYYPSTAYVLFSTSGASGNVIHITALGKSSEDGFAQDQGFPGPTRPRWGDYSWAIFVPPTAGTSGGIYFASNYIEHPNCSDQVFMNTGGTCGGTRDQQANWGSSVNRLAP